ncbi:MAG: hypothetical protein ABIR70_15955 [Bryobacteraceae bacterium]
MAFCPKCGSATEGSFCPACGAQVNSAAAPSATPAPPLDDHIVNALCYLVWPLTGVLFLVLDPYKTNRAVRFHAIQSILVFVAIFAGFQALQFLAFTPWVGLFFSLITLGYPIGAFMLWIFLMIKAYTKVRFVVPVLGALAESQA